MDKLKKALAYIGAAFLALLVGVAVWLGLRGDKQPEIAIGYDPIRDLIDDHFTELGKLKKDRIKIRFQRLQIEQHLSKIEANEFKNAILAAIDVGDTDELASIRSRYLAKYDIHRDAENATTDNDN